MWLDFSGGQVIVKDPDGRTLAKLRRLARTLQARVQGDDGEFYDSWVSGPVLAGSVSVAAGGSALSWTGL